jgi:aspartate racemase
MRTIGLIGGMSWQSTALYYQFINREAGARLGGLRSAALHCASLDFEEIVVRQRHQDWDGLAAMLSNTARGLVAGGAECILIGTNTMHRVAPAVEAAVGVPLLHIVDATAAAIRRAGQSVVGLLGTWYTMEHPFYAERMVRHGIHCLVPDEAEREQVHRVIFEELCQGHFEPRSFTAVRDMAERLAARGAQGIVLGCTELPLLLQAGDCGVPLYDSTQLHALAAVDFALEGSPLLRAPVAA